MTAKTDISFTTDGIFYTIYANTKGGEHVWNTIYKAMGCCKFTAQEWASIKKQIKDAGYSVRKQRASKQTLDDILAELEL